MAGAAIGSAIDKAEERKYEERIPQRRNLPEYERVYMDDVVSMLEIRHAEILESQRDGVLTRGEECTVVFEIHNTSDNPVYDICPFVEDATGNKHINISPNLRIESIGPRQAVRYTATILADKKLKDGVAKIQVGATVNNRDVDAGSHEITIVTRRK